MKLFRTFNYTIILLAFSLLVQAQRDTVPVNTDWQFTKDENAEGLTDKWFEKTMLNTVTVQLPHTWNVEEENQNHYGWGWYQKKINIPKETQEEIFVCLPEERDSDLIESIPLPPGVCYTTVVDGWFNTKWQFESEFRFTK